MNSCLGCRSHYRERHWWIFVIDFCGVTRTTFRQTPACPKLSEKNMDGRTVSLAVDRPARTTTVLHE